MNIDVSRRRVSYFRLLVWLLMGMVVLLQTTPILHFAPEGSEFYKSVLRYLFILLWVLQGFGLWWAQKVGKRRPDAIPDTSSE